MGWKNTDSPCCSRADRLPASNATPPGLQESTRAFLLEGANFTGRFGLCQCPGRPDGIALRSKLVTAMRTAYTPENLIQNRALPHAVRRCGSPPLQRRFAEAHPGIRVSPGSLSARWRRRSPPTSSRDTPRSSAANFTPRGDPERCTIIEGG